MTTKPKHIVIKREQHQPSMHVVGQKNVLKITSPDESEQNNETPKIESALKEWLPELSFGILILYISKIIARVAIVLFRLPQPKKVIYKAKIEESLSGQSSSNILVGLKQVFRPWMPKTLSVGVVMVIIFGGIYTADQSIAKLSYQVQSEAEHGMNRMIYATQALQNGDYILARQHFEAASQLFSQANGSVPTGPDWAKQIGEYIPIYRTVIAAEESFIVAGNLADLGTRLSQSFAENGSANVFTTSATVYAEQAKLYGEIDRAISLLQELSPNTVPAEYREAFMFAQQEVLPSLRHVLLQVRDINTVVYALSGMENKQRIFLAFQNSNELRASGGFMGSYALVSVDKGKVVQTEVPSGGTYDVQGQQLAVLLPPPPLSLVANKLELQDANWWPDWPTSAQQISELYESAGGSTVDGVVAINAQVLSRILEVIGPIRLDQYDLTLTAENVIAETQNFAEFTSSDVNAKPKQIIQDMTAIVSERLEQMVKDDPATVSSIFFDALVRKDIQVYHRDHSVLEALSRLGWTGSLPTLASGQDGLAVVHSNIAGQKTDEVMEDSVQYSVRVKRDGTAIGTVIISREHLGEKGQLFTGVRNVNYVRVYAPLGSKLISAEGFEQPEAKFFDAPAPFAEISARLNAESHAKVSQQNTAVYDELGRTVFGNWMMTDPGEKSVVRLVYQLPIKFSETDNDWWSIFTKSNHGQRYSFVWTQQSGVRRVDFRHSFEHENPINSVNSTESIETTGNGWSLNKIVSDNLVYFVEYDVYDPS